jgi:BirA family biotin operon repressor/biotin-[acetyl-CoA-carboxylase] ligase
MEQLLRLLGENCGGCVSGGALAKELAVSRNAVWKAVESLRANGYDISAVRSKGYRLETSGDLLSAGGINDNIRNSGAFHVEVRKSLTSTNTVLREAAAKGAPEGYVIAAEEQTAGKGRQGRAFHSPAGHGAYFSLLLRPGYTASDAALLTSAAAVAAARAIEEVFGVSVGIKWVNDLFVDGKKVCGILTEASFDMESGLIESAVLGIGINVTMPEDGFPEELRNVAASLTERRTGKDSERCRLIAATLDDFWEYYENLSARAFLDEYRSRSIVLGHDIYVLTGGAQRQARALAIDDGCGLVVRYEGGETATVNSGEVRVVRR